MIRAGLTPREADIADRLARGMTYRGIADEFSVSINTIKTHARRVYAEYAVANRAELKARLKPRRSENVTTYSLEVQLLRNWEPRSRPSVGELRLSDPMPSHMLLYPGAAAEDHERMLITIEGATRISNDWAAFRAGLTIDGQSYSEPRPGLVYLGLSDIPSAIIHFPLMATERSRMFRGWHTLLCRTIHP